MFRKSDLAAVAIICTFLAGCSSSRCTVTGTVTYEDGTPVESGVVIAEATVDGKLVAVQGAIRNGAFSWGGAREGDGALPGLYKVAVLSPLLSEYQLAQGKTVAIDGRFSKYETSGLSFEVKLGKNEFPIKVTKPKNSRREQQR